MGLYRNIAGVNDPDAMGLLLLSPPTLQTGLLMDQLPSLQQSQQDVWAAKNAKYDYLLSHSFDELTQSGYYVTTDNGSIFQWLDAAHNTSSAYLPIQDTQEIENSRGTAGALLLHMKEPEIAKDTAGYASGGSTSTGSTAQYSDPIPTVQDLPPVVKNPDGGVSFEYTGPISIPGETTPPKTTTQTPAAAAKNNIVPLVTIGGLLAIALAGDAVLGGRSKLVFIGGVGALFYLMAKRG